MKDIKHIRRDFHLVAWVMPQGLDLGEPWGVWGLGFIFSPKFNQIWCESYLHEWHMQRHNGLGPRPMGPWGGTKRSNISITKSLSKIFKSNFVCLLTDERYKTYQTRFSLGRLGQAPEVGLRVLWGLGGQIVFP